MATRAERRKTNYAYHRSQGFSVIESRRMRDVSANKADAIIAERKAKIRNTPRAKRTKQENEQAVIFAKQEREKRDRLERDRILRKQDERLQLFRNWSGSEFPDEYLEIIYDINRRAGKIPFERNSYGYRVFYHMFVYDKDGQEAIAIVKGSPDGS